MVSVGSWLCVVVMSQSLVGAFGRVVLMVVRRFKLELWSGVVSRVVGTVVRVKSVEVPSIRVLKE